MSHIASVKARFATSMYIIVKHQHNTTIIICITFQQLQELLLLPGTVIVKVSPATKSPSNSVTAATHRDSLPCNPFQPLSIRSVGKIESIESRYLVNRVVLQEHVLGEDCLNTLFSKMEMETCSGMDAARLSRKKQMLV